MKLEVLVECCEVEKWHRVLDISFESDTGRIFVAVSHGPEECGFPLPCTGTIPIWMTKGFREKE